MFAAESKGGFAKLYMARVRIARIGRELSEKSASRINGGHMIFFQCEHKCNKNFSVGVNII